MSYFSGLQLLALGVALPGAVHAAPPVILQSTTRADWQAAGNNGTGCYWSRRQGGPVLFAASGRTAVAKVRGRRLLFSPRRDARDLFPFTYDTWSSGRLVIRVVDSGVVKAMGEEAVTTDATLIVIDHGKARQWKGSMICGS